VGVEDDDALGSRVFDDEARSRPSRAKLVKAPSTIAQEIDRVRRR
jgi:hypothetical protein